MAYKIVGVDENSLFPPRVETEINSKIDGKVNPAVADINSALSTLETTVSEKADSSFVESELAGKAPLNLSGEYAARPAANTVPDGTVFYAINVPEAYRSNGVTWQVIGSGGNEIGYAERLSNFTGSATSRMDVPGVAITFVAGERPIEIEMFADVGSNTASTSSGSIPRVFAVLNNDDILYMGHYIAPVAGAAQTYATHNAKRRLTGLTPGEGYTVKMQIGAQAGTNSPIVNAYPHNPMFLRASTV